jgi:tRNA threonylcarbamoyladenosine biosynthesis protein TsaB
VLGARATDAGLTIAAADAVPLYVRDRVAQTTAERAASRAASLANVQGGVAA